MRTIATRPYTPSAVMDTTQRIAYQPALDGVRALAVAVVLLFHAQVPGFGAGYLGVSVFFTLSGFLITMLLVEEHRSTATIDLSAFYARRVRRLLPASVVTITIVATLAATTDLFAGVTSMRRQVIGSLLQVVNWVFLADEGSYQERLAGASGAVSPLEHFWSLAIEEQFYWFWPVAVLGLFGAVRSRRGRTLALGGLTAVAIALAPLVAVVWGGDAAYWATPARLSEILVGAFLALVLAGRSLSARWSVLAPIGLAVLGVFVVTFPSSDRVAGAGALPLVAVVSGVLLLGLQADGSLRTGLSAAPLVWLGRVSYGVYLYHWPIFVIVDAQRLGTGGLVLFVVRIALTLVVAQLSYVALEYPIRRARPQWTRPTFGVAGVATVTALLAAWVIVPPADSDYWQLDSATVQAAAIEVDDAPLAPAPSTAPADTTPADTAPAETAPDDTTMASVSGPVGPSTTAPLTPAATTTAAPTTTAVPTTAAPTTTVPPLPELARPVRILVTGDSTAQALGTGVVQWAADHPELAQAEVVAAPGCGFLRGGERRHGDSTESMEPCDPWVADQLLPAVERTRPDVVVVMVTSWDIVDRRWDTEALIGPTDPPFRERLERDYGDMVDEVIGRGASKIALVRPPIPNPFWLDRDDPDDQRRRFGVIDELYAGLASDRPGTVTIVPMADWFSDAGLDDERDLRPDGVHLDPDGATRLTEDRLGEHLIRVALGNEAS
jgi:peptidoglycan/LPS O-acetylase OafA/YrhL/lysophospholipase L1-like esterase